MLVQVPQAPQLGDDSSIADTPLQIIYIGLQLSQSSYKLFQKSYKLLILVRTPSFQPCHSIHKAVHLLDQGRRSILVWGFSSFYGGSRCKLQTKGSSSSAAILGGSCGTEKELPSSSTSVIYVFFAFSHATENVFPTVIAPLLLADLFTTDLAPFDLPSVHFTTNFSMV